MVLFCFGFGWTLTSPAAHKTLWYLPKQGNKTNNYAGSEYWRELQVELRLTELCVSDSSRILEATAIPPLKRTLWIYLQRPGSWVTSSWCSTLGLWLRKWQDWPDTGSVNAWCGSGISKAPPSNHSHLGHSCPGCWWTVFGGLQTLFSLKNKGFHS